MVDVVDVKYCGMLSTRLKLFKVKSNSPYRANFRCNICNDSELSKSKTRGWLLEKSNSIFYYCHNCGASHPLWRYLKETDLALYNQYVIDTQIAKYGSDTAPKEEKPLDTITNQVPKFLKSGSPLLKIKKISQLDPKHPARIYVNKRMIPTNQHFRLYYAPKFAQWVNSIIPNKLPTEIDEPRLIIPFLNTKGEMYGFQGRSFGKSGMRYITIMIDEDQPKAFGMDRVDLTKKYYVLEGPLDSLFLPNAIAFAGSDGKIGDKNAVFVFDNEPRNKEICSKIEKLIDVGYQVCIWPHKDVDIKDINDMIISGIAASEVQAIIDENTFSGLGAKLSFAIWRK